MLRDGVRTNPVGVPRPVQRATQKGRDKTGQADGVSTRPRVGKTITLLDLHEKFCTRTPIGKKVDTTQKRFYLGDT